MDDREIAVGIGVLILKDGKVLLGKRKGAHGAGEFAFPGGRLEYGESFEDCARRETMEECGIELENVRFQMLSNVLSYLPRQWVHLGMIADWKAGEPVVCEPEKCEGWGWYDLSELPTPMFTIARVSIECLKDGNIYIPVS